MVWKKCRMVAAVRTTVRVRADGKGFAAGLSADRVSPAASADIESVTASSCMPGCIDHTRTAIVADAEPEITPQISPITSLQNDDTRPAFRMSFKASPASGTLREGHRVKRLFIRRRHGHADDIKHNADGNDADQNHKRNAERRVCEQIG